MSTESSGAATSPMQSSPKQAFYEQLARALHDGGFDQHMGALCKPFISEAEGPTWWVNNPSSYFRLLFVGFLDGIESEQELCWSVEDSRLYRDFIGLDAHARTPDPPTLGQIRKRIMPLIHSEAFDKMMRIVESSKLLDSVPNDPSLSGIRQRIRAKEHHDYWKRLTKTPGASRSVRPSAPPNQPGGAMARGVAEARPSESFAMWSEDLSAVSEELAQLRASGIADFRAYFAEHESPAVDCVMRACVYGRGPNSVRAFLTARSEDVGRELPQTVTAGTLDACKSIATALAEGKRQIAVECPMLDANAQPATVVIQLAVQPDFEESLGSVVVSYTDVSRRNRAAPVLPVGDAHIERTLNLNQVGVWEWDISNDVSHWSDAMLRIYGITRREFTGRHSDYLDSTYPEDRDIQRESVRQSFADLTKHAPDLQPSADSSASFKDYRIRRQDGQVRWVRGGAVEVVDDQGRPVKMQGVLWDITESKHAELMLRESEEHHRHIVSDLPLPITVTAFDGEVLYANDAALSFFGVGRDQLKNLRASDYWEIPEQRNTAMAVLAERGELRGFEAKYCIGAEREPRVALLTSSVVDYGGRNVLVSCHQDITGLHCAEDQLQSAQRLAEEQLQETRKFAEEQLQETRSLADEQLRQAQRHSDELLRRAEERANEQLQHTVAAAEQRLQELRLEGEEQLRAVRAECERAIDSRKREIALLKKLVEMADVETSRVLGFACREIAQAYELPLVMAGLLAEDRSTYVVVAAHTQEAVVSPIGNQAQVPGELWSRIFTEQPRPLWIEDLATDDRVLGIRDLVTPGSCPSCLLVPLVIDGVLGGLLLLGTKPPTVLDAEAIDIVWNATGQVVHSLSMARLRETQQRLTLALDKIRAIAGSMIGKPND